MRNTDDVTELTAWAMTTADSMKVLLRDSWGPMWTNLTEEQMLYGLERMYLVGLGLICQISDLTVYPDGVGFVAKVQLSDDMGGGYIQMDFTGSDTVN